MVETRWLRRDVLVVLLLSVAHITAQHRETIMELGGNGVLAEFMHVFIFSDTHGAFLDGCSGVAAFLSSYFRPLRSK
jgi:hypothetical protein